MRPLQRLSFQFLQRFDWPLFAIGLLLSALGLTAIYSVDLSRGGDLAFFRTQLFAFGLGIFLYTIVSLIHIRRYESGARLFYLLGLLGLVVVLFFGETIRGTKGWFRIGGLSIQPSELAKLSLAIVLAWLVSRYGRRFDRWQFVLASGLLAGVYILLIFFQPDIGTAALLFLLWFGTLLVTRVQWRFIVFILGILGILGSLGWTFFLADYQKDRFVIFLHPNHDPLGSGYNVAQSIIAVGAGLWTGRGLGFGSQSQLHFLPEAQTDFLFSVIAEELGFLGVFLLLSLYGLCFWRLLLIAGEVEDEFGRYLIILFLLLLSGQTFVNIGGAVGLLPLTGVPLPFVSYGGTALLAMWTGLGLVQSIVRSYRVKESALAKSGISILS